MITTRNLSILAVVLIALFGISLLQKSGHEKSTSRSSVTELVATGLTADDLDRITIGYGSDSEAVVLVRTPAGWVVETAWNAAASQQRIDALVRNLTGLTGEFRSDSAEVLADYGLDGAGSVTVRATGTDGATAIALDVGRKPERYPGNFVRRPDDNRVFVSQKNVLSQLGIYGDPELPQSRFFLELQAVQEDRLAVDRIVVQGVDFAWDLAKEFAAAAPVPDAPDSAAAAPGIDRNTWEWQATTGSGPALAKSKVDAVLNALVAIRATDLVDPGADAAVYGLANPGRRAELHLQDGSAIVLEFGDDRAAAEGVPAGTYMRRVGEPTVWVVTEYAMKNIFKPLAELQAE